MSCRQNFEICPVPSAVSLKLFRENWTGFGKHPQNPKKCHTRHFTREFTEKQNPSSYGIKMPICIWSKTSSITVQYISC